MKNICALMLASMVVLTMVGCKKGDSSPDDVATVNGKPISMKEFYDYVIRKPRVEVKSNSGPVQADVSAPIGLQALRDLVNNQLILQMAEKEGVLPDDKAVQAEIDLRNRLNPNYLSSILKQPGVSLGMVQKDVKLTLAQSNLLTKGINVSAADVDKYINDNPHQFEKPADDQLLFVQVGDKAKTAQVDKDLASGQSFQTVAERYSEAQDVQKTHAQVAMHDPNRYPPELRAAIDQVSEGKTTPWMHLGPNYYKFYVEHKTPAVPLKRDDDLKTMVRRQIAETRGRESVDLQRQLADALKGGDIKVNLPALSPEWERAMTELRAAAKTTGATDSPAMSSSGSRLAAPSGSGKN